MHSSRLSRALLGVAALALAACTTTETEPDPGSQTTRVVVAQPVAVPPPPPVATRPPPPIEEAPEERTLEAPSRFAELAGWSDLDARPALAAFRRTCGAWRDADPDAPLSPRLPQYGTFADWKPACAALDRADATSAAGARAFFEAQFAPVTLTTPDAEDGLLTGYYEPELSVRRVPDATHSEPVLARPSSEQTLKLPRSQINEKSSRVIAYGRPIDVFFMQIQGSGRLRYEDGRVLRAAFAGHNSKPYTSIGRKLVEWGELSKEKASKGNIEAWMEAAGPMRARGLMNENARYIWFEEQSIAPGEGPLGAMRVPLTGMGSIALDPRYHPYGTVAFLETKLPASPRDYRGKDAQVLVVGQDTGGAIKGPLRGDLFFGAGAEAGGLAGVMKHPVRWTLLLPAHLADGPQLSAGLSVAVDAGP